MSKDGPEAEVLKESPTFDSNVVYKGWIPTITGRLSFTLVGESSYPDVAYTTNFVKNNSRFIVCHQRRSELDTVLPFKLPLARFFFNIEGDHVGVCLAVASDDPTLEKADLRGYLYWFPRDETWFEVKSVIEDFQEQLERTIDNRRSASDDGINRIFKDKQEELKGYSYFNVRFHLDRTGECTIYSSKHLLVSESAPGFSTDETDREHERHLVCDQLFYFLRDISHKHQHHSPKSDSLSNLHRCEPGEIDRWRHEVVRSLTLAVLREKRQRGSGVTRALGIVAYIKSFRKIFDQPNKSVIPGYSEEFLEDSVRAISEQDKENRERKDHGDNVRRTTYLGLAGLGLSIGSLYSIVQRSVEGELKVDPDVFLVYSGRFIVENFTLCIAVIFLTVTVYWGHSRVYNWEQRNLTRDILRLVSPLGQRVAAGAMLLLSVCAIYLGISFLPS